MKYKRFLVFEGDNFDCYSPFSDLDSFDTLDDAIKHAQRSTCEDAIVFDCDHRAVKYTASEWHPNY